MRNSVGRAHPNYGKTKAFINAALLYTGNDCIIWPFATTGHSYPSLKGWQQVHRIVCEKVHGPPPSLKHEAAHSCGVKKCINPLHLRWATRSENQMDRVRHGTGKRGPKHHNVKLNEHAVTSIRESKAPGYVLAQLYSVSQQTICDVRKRRSWVWL